MLTFLVIISGLDECGRGSLAGPLVGAIACIHEDLSSFLDRLKTPLRDSKKLTKNQRNNIYLQRDSLPITYAIESISVTEINEKGITWANQEIFVRLFQKIPSDKYLVDGNLRFSDPRAESIIKGDNLHPQIMLASVIAKVFRDQLMFDLHPQYSEYGWDSNVGYGSPTHLKALLDYGPTPHHRTLFVRHYV